MPEEPIPPFIVKSGDQQVKTVTLKYTDPKDEGFLPGLVARPVALPGFSRWQIESVFPRRDVNCVAWSPDGKQIACGTAGGRVRVYAVSNGELVRLHADCGKAVLSLAWDRVAGWLAARYLKNGDAGGCIRVWDASGQLISDFGGGDMYRSIAWSPDGRWLAASSCEPQLWHPDGRPGPELKRPGTNACCVAWHPDASRLASANQDGTVTVWDVAGKLMFTLAGHEGQVRSVTWSPDGQWLVSGGLDKTVRFWKPDGTQGSVIHEHEDSVECVAWSGDGSLLATASRSAVRYWTADGRPSGGIEMGVGEWGCPAVAWSPDGQTLAHVHLSRIRLWRRDGSEATQLPSGATIVKAVSCSRNWERIAAGGDDGTIRLFDSQANAFAVMGTQDHRPPVQGLAWARQGNRLASTGENGSQIWQLDGTPGPRLEGPSLSIDWNSDGEMLATGAPAATSSFGTPTADWARS